MVVKKLMDQDDHIIETLTAWFMDWWGTKEGFSKEKMQYYVKIHINPGQALPQTFVLLQEEELAGVYQLSMSDLDVRPDRYPWLINVYIAPTYRGQGGLTLMMESLKETMHSMKIPCVYLYTYHKGLYEKYGFQFVENFHTYINPDDIQRLYQYAP